ncbi:hypothetical protein [Usitatibacter rugosus]|nr:hypothetical protein [Usitatibacter rugosus]
MNPLLAIHVLISLVAIAIGLYWAAGLLRNDRMDKATAWFLALTIATSATGFILPAEKILPSHITGILSLILLAMACVARYPKKMNGAWRGIFLFTAVASLYLNVFVLVVQLFLKVPALKALAPQQNEPPFLAAQGLTLVVFVAIGILSLKRFRPIP